MSKPGDQSDVQNDVQNDIQNAVEANENDAQALFDIYVYDDQTGQAKMQKFVTLGSFKNIQGTKLSDIRAMLNNENGLSFRLQGSPFCNKVGAVANESLPFTEYLKSLDRGGAKKVENSGQQEYSSLVPTGDMPVTEPQAYAVYFKSRALTSAMDDTAKQFLKEKLDLELRRAELNKVDKPDILASSYNHKDFMAAISKGTVVHPADMTQEHWNIVMETNALLRGSYVRRPRHGVAKKVERAMFPAFKLKARRFDGFNVSPDHKDIVTPAKYLFIPRYRVEDDSYVEVSENKSSVACAIASSSLSETAAEVAVGGGVFGYSAGAKGGFKNEEAASTSESHIEDHKQMTITYNFPRVVLQLDEDSLQVSEECEEALKLVTDKESLQNFKAKYGTLFATRVELGGRLHATEDSEALGTASVSQKAKAMKAAASLSFSSPWVQASASASSASSSTDQRENSVSSLNMGMTWQAKGGDTLLCNNPPAWCSTVVSFYNWRVVKQENLLSIEDMISRIPGHQSVKSHFEKILESKQEEQTLREDSVKVRFKPTKDDHHLCLEKEPADFISNTVTRKNVLLAKGIPDQNTPTVIQWRKENSKHWRHLSLFPRGDGRLDIFNLHGMIDTSKGRLLSNGSYTICCDMEKTYLQGTSMIPEFQGSFLHDGAKVTAWKFNMKSVNPVRKPGANLEHGDEVQIEVCDVKGQPLGLMSFFVSVLMGGVFGDREVKTFKLEYVK